MNRFGLFFTKGNTIIRLPVNPQTLPVEQESDNGEYNVMGIGQIMVPRIPNLRTVSISSFFPGRIFPGVLTSGGFEPPEFYLDFFRSAMEEKTPILYTPVRHYEDGEPFLTGDEGFLALVTQFNVEERGGETGDFYYELSLTEYRDYSPQTVDVQFYAEEPEAIAEPNRDIPQGQITVGCTCIANGRYYYSSYGDEPHGNANGRRVKVSRIVDDSRPDPIHITTESGGWLGWTARASLQVVSDT